MLERCDMGAEGVRVCGATFFKAVGLMSDTDSYRADQQAEQKSRG